MPQQNRPCGQKLSFLVEPVTLPSAVENFVFGEKEDFSNLKKVSIIKFNEKGFLWKSLKIMEAKDLVLGEN